jgi:hypothetical protein
MPNETPDELEKDSGGIHAELSSDLSVTVTRRHGPLWVSFTFSQSDLKRLLPFLCNAAGGVAARSSDRMLHCPECRFFFLPKRSDAVYCSPACRQLAWERRRAEPESRFRITARVGGRTFDRAEAMMLEGVLHHLGEQITVSLEPTGGLLLEMVLRGRVPAYVMDIAVAKVEEGLRLAFPPAHYPIGLAVDGSEYPILELEVEDRIPNCPGSRRSLNASEIASQRAGSDDTYATCSDCGRIVPCRRLGDNEPHMMARHRPVGIG